MLSSMDHFRFNSMSNQNHAKAIEMRTISRFKDQLKD
jgi:hypothetical protein